jgi:hypothetical protein
VRGYGFHSRGSGSDPGVKPCEHGNEPTGCIKDDEFLDKLSDN